MIDYGVILFYLLFTLLFGIYKGRKVQNVRDYTVSQGSFDTTALVATIFGTIIGGGSTMEPVAKIYTFGIILFFPYIGECFSKLIMSEIIAPKFDRFHKMISVGDIMESAYGKCGKVITGIGGFLLSSGYVGIQISATSTFISYFTGMSLTGCVVLSTVVMVTYAAFGGIRAVTATDVVQFIVIIVALPVVAHLALYKVGGWHALFESLPKEKLSLSLNSEEIRLELFTIFIYCLPYMSPAVMQRLLMAKNTQQTQRSFRIAALIDVPFYLVLALIALCVAVLNPSLDPTLVMPYMIDNHLPVLFKGLAIAGILAIVMSTADSYLTSASVTLVHDVVKPLYPGDLQDKQELLLMRISTVLIGGIAAANAIYFKSIMAIHFNAASIWVPVILFPMVALMLGKSKDLRAFLVAGIAGFAFTYLWAAIFPKINSLFPGLFFNALVFWLMPCRKNVKAPTPAETY